MVMRAQDKKIYCSQCKKLVKRREQKANGNVNYSCSQCSKIIWTFDGVNWRYIKSAALKAG